MNTNPLRRKRGIALIVVLVFLVLLSVFVVSFFSNSQDELAAAQSFTGEVSASHLAESAVSIVMGQIREATSRTNGAWGSQPGMIRVYGSGGAASDEVDAFFKLYSSNDMIVSGKEVDAFDLAKEVPEGATKGWNNNPALWTDMNEAVSVPLPSVTQNGMATQASMTFRYPILDPSLYQKVEGLDFIKNSDAVGTSAALPARMPVRWMYVLKDGTLTLPTDSAANGSQAVWVEGAKAPSAANPIVGRIAFWTDDETSKVNINTAGGYSLKPAGKNFDGGKPAKDLDGKEISEDDYAGAFWDTPRVLTEFDRGQLDLTEFSSTMKRAGLAISQPVRGEFQRYPGHPSTTSLGLLFRDLPTNSGDSMQDAPYVLTSGQLALLAPRLQYSMDSSDDGHRARCSNFGTDRLISKFDEAPDLRVKRLYASVDELFFSQPDPALAKPARLAMDQELKVAKAVMTPSLLEKMRFFLTAYSRAPELNLFGRPRVTMWPVRAAVQQGDAENYWNASDRLIAFCSTMGPKAGEMDNGAVVTEDKVKRFLFQRINAYSPTSDSSIQRNKDLLAYLRSLTDKSFPGFGGKSFATKYADSNLYGGPNNESDPLGRWQILAEMFDYIRCVNLRDSTRDKQIAGSTTDADGVMHPTQQQVQKMETYKYAPRGIVVPSTMSQSGVMLPKSQVRLGFGRFPIISEAALVLYHSGYRADVTKRGNDGNLTKTTQYLYSDVPYKPLEAPETREAPEIDANLGESIKITHSLVRAFMVFETFNPMQGYAPINGPASGSLETGKIFMVVEGLQGFSLKKANSEGVVTSLGSLGFLDVTGGLKNSYNFGPASFWGGRNTGGCEGFFHTLVKLNSSSVGTATEYDPAQPTTPEKQPYWYPFQTVSPVTLSSSKAWVNPCVKNGVEVPVADTRAGRMNEFMDLVGTTVTLRLKYEGTEIYNFPLRFPDATVQIPTDLIRGGYAQDGETADTTNLSNPRTGQPATSNAWYSSDPGGFLRNPGEEFWAASVDAQKRLQNPLISRMDKPTRMVKSLAGRMTWLNRADSGDYTNPINTTRIDYRNKWRNILQPGDTVRSVVYGVNPQDKEGSGQVAGKLRTDLRLAALNSETTIAFGPHPDYQNRNVRQAQNLRMSDGSTYFPGKALAQEVKPNMPPPPVTILPATNFGNIAKLDTGKYPAAQAADLPDGPAEGSKTNGVIRNDGGWGDFDTGLGNLADGPFCNKADEGNLAYRHEEKDANGQSYKPDKHWKYDYPYFTWSYDETFETFFTPNRQVPSAVLFGSLPSGKYSNWQTLCFSPVPAGKDHPGRSDKYPKDYLWLDLFTMPVVEPYAISEPFSTAGKINMNYQIVPFMNIKRSSGMRAALQPVRVTAIPNARVADFKTGSGTDARGWQKPKLMPDGVKAFNYRYLVDRDETLKAFDAYFEEYVGGVGGTHKKGFFKSAAQICDFYLYPRQNRKPIKSWIKGEDDIKNWWDIDTTGLTGDNVREKPYADLYARLTTKSNTFCVHIRAQVLRQSGPTDTTNPDIINAHYRTWDEKKDRVIGEYRGSSIIERYIDPQDERFVASAKNGRIDVDSANLDTAYRFRVLNTKRFDP